MPGLVAELEGRVREWMRPEAGLLSYLVRKSFLLGWAAGGRKSTTFLNSFQHGVPVLC